MTVTETSGTPRTITNTATIDSDETSPTTSTDQTEISTSCGAAIPEFPTLALPVISVIAMLYMIRRRT